MSDSEEELVEKRLKVVVVGDSGSGKRSNDSSEEELARKRMKVAFMGDSGFRETSIVVRFCNNEFTRQYTPTAGIDFFLKNLSLEGCKNVSLHIWDVGGLALYGNMLDKYIFDAHIILLVYDVTNSSSFDILQEWMNEIKQLCGAPQRRPLMAIMGNKCDMEHQRTVKRERSYHFAAENGLKCLDVSARTGESVALCIVNMVAQVLGVCLTRTDQDSRKPIVEGEISDTVKMPRVVKKYPKKHNQMDLNAAMLPSKSTVCSLQ